MQGNRSSNGKDAHGAQEELQNEIAELEDLLRKAKQRLECSELRCEQPPRSSSATLTTSSRGSSHTDLLHQDASPTTQARPSHQLQAQTPPQNASPPRHHSPSGAPLSHHQHHQHHNLLLLADSALPLGSFAFSSGFESYRAHMRAAAAHPSSSSSSSSHPASSWSFEADFLPLSVASFAATSLPFMLAGYRAAAAGESAAACLAELDDACDAATVCAVARRASVAQGRALLGVWEKSFAPAGGGSGAAADEDEGGGGDGYGDGDGGGDGGPVRALKEFAALVRLSSSSSSASASSAAAAARRKAAASAEGAGARRNADNAGGKEEQEDEDETDEPLPPSASAHFAPLFGAVARAMMGSPPPPPSSSLAPNPDPDPAAQQMTAQQQAAYAFVLGHARAVTSAAMRAGVLGPFRAQRILAGAGTRRLIAAAVARQWDTPVEAAGQTAPALDLWVGRHEILYSKIFNS
ncbi:hypothetical protein SLS62_006798 [Diatrype stigma]|uniref:Urease accessory protein UreF n=1 Tax=Diatrype stigma TaxID=117547 RepID=A0AAN9V0H0_9PEZI